MTRIPLVEPDDFTPEQKEFYSRSPAARMNLSRLLAHGRTLHEGFTKFSLAIISQLTIPPLEREIIVLAVLHLERGEYEWVQHLQIAGDMGIPEEKIAAIAQHRFNAAVFDEREKALLAFTRQVVKSVRVDDCVFDALAAFYDARQIVESIFTIGIYMMILRISEVAELDVDAVHGADVVRQALS